MRTNRRSLGTTAVAVSLLLLSGSSVVWSAAPDPSAVSPESTASASAPPSAAEPASPETPPDTPCEPTSVRVDPEYAIRGQTVRVDVTGFLPNVPIASWLGDQYDPESKPPIGTGTTDASGAGVIVGVVPVEAEVGEHNVTVWANDECVAFAWLMVSLSARAIGIDDETVLPGQSVTVTVGGFMADGRVDLSIDSAPTQGECWPEPCLYLGYAMASDVGSASIAARIPDDTSRGTHTLWVSGWAPDAMTEFNLGIDITVIGASGTLPPTDTESTG